LEIRDAQSDPYHLPFLSGHVRHVDATLEDRNLRSVGSPTSRLIPTNRHFAPITGIPRMSAIPVRVHISLMNVVALEGANDGILANAIMPVALVTRMAGGGNYTPEQLAHFQRLFAPFGAAVTPDFVTPLVVYLASSTCRTTKGIYSASAGRFARVFVGTTEGWYGPRDVPASAQDIAEHFAEIEDRSRYGEIADLLDEASVIGKRITGDGCVAVDAQERAARAILQGIAAGSIDLSLLSGNFVFVADMAGTLDATAFAQGVAQTRRIFREPLKMAITGITAGAGRMAIEAESEGILIDGNTYRNQYHWLFCFDDRGLITRVREYGNTKTVADVMWPVFNKLGGFVSGH
jgi:ketosteroid isomerase-like protein